jgi:short-subunit dehydrogenase
MGEFDWLSWNQIQSQIDVNLLGTMRVIKGFLPLIIKSKGIIS